MTLTTCCPCPSVPSSGSQRCAVGRTPGVHLDDREDEDRPAGCGGLKQYCSRCSHARSADRGSVRPSGLASFRCPCPCSSSSSCSCPSAHSCPSRSPHACARSDPSASAASPSGCPAGAADCSSSAADREGPALCSRAHSARASASGALPPSGHASGLHDAPWGYGGGDGRKCAGKETERSVLPSSFFS